MTLNKRYLVTGAAGFVGKHLVRELQSMGAAVTAFSRNDLDVTDEAATARAIAEGKPDVIFHLAASHDRNDIRRAFEVNVTGTLNVLNAARGVENVITLGSAEEYGSNLPPFEERMREAPVSAYSMTKVFATHLVQTMHRTANVPCVILRPSIVYGPGQGGAMFVPSLIRSLAAGERFRMTKGEQTRDFVFVSDVVDALIRAANIKDASVINIGSGRSVAIREVACKVAAIMNRPDLLDIGALEYRPSEIMQYTVDIKRARDVLGWTPRVSLDEGLQRTIRES